jgi:hypothetical protein
VSVASDKEIVEAIVIVVAHGNTSGVASARDAGKDLIHSEFNHIGALL